MGARIQVKTSHTELLKQRRHQMIEKKGNKRERKKRERKTERKKLFINNPGTIRSKSFIL